MLPWAAFHLPNSVERCPLVAGPGILHLLRQDPALFGGKPPRNLSSRKSGHKILVLQQFFVNISHLGFYDLCINIILGIH